MRPSRHDIVRDRERLPERMGLHRAVRVRRYDREEELHPALLGLHLSRVSTDDVGGMNSYDVAISVEAP